MKKYLGLAFGALALAVMAAAAQSDKPSGGTVKVTVHYTGTGTVDDSHKVYVVLWDSPDFVQPGVSAPPVEVKSTSSKDGSVTFTGVKSPAYFSSAYDPKGTWDAQSMPPSGTSLGLYSKEPGKPAPVEVKAGETVSITLTFDDTQKIP